MSVLESSIERRCAAYASQQGCVLLKIDKRTGWPDRLCLLPNGRHFFVEFKRPGGEMSLAQQHVQNMLRGMNHNCWEVDNVHLFKRLIHERLVLPAA